MDRVHVHRDPSPYSVGKSGAINFVAGRSYLAVARVTFRARPAVLPSQLGKLPGVKAARPPPSHTNRADGSDPSARSDKAHNHKS